MPATRRSARVAGSNAATSPHTSPKAAKKGTKRKADDSPKGKSSSKKMQTTIEESMPDANDASKDEDMKEATPKAEDDSTQTGAVRDGAAEDEIVENIAPKDSEMEDAPAANEEALAVNDEAGAAKAEGNTDAKSETAHHSQNGDNVKADESEVKDQLETSVDGDTVLDESKGRDQAEIGIKGAELEEGNSQDQSMASANGDFQATTAQSEGESKNGDSGQAPDQNGHSAEDQIKANPDEEMAESKGNLIEDASAREAKISSNIIEKGIVYFFTRERVGVEHADGAQDLQRTYFVLRPIPRGAKLGDGALDDSKMNRLLALPKKVFPKSGKDRFMAFVEKSKASMSELREDFFKGGEYNTKTMGTRETHAVTPVGEGVYAITEVGRSAHLAYMLTIPREPGQVQDELGLRGTGSFVLSLKNPNSKGPANAQLPEKPDFPQEILDDFGGLAWKPVTKPEYLDYPNAQLLLIGEGQDKFGSAVQASEQDKKEGRDSPEKELEKLESEDEIRIDALDAEDAVFADLHISKDEYSSVQTTW